MDLKKKSETLAAQPYTVVVVKDLTTEDEPAYLALSPELEGCMGQGRTKEEAVENLSEARIDYIQSLLEDGLPVPAPQTHLTITTSGSSATFTYQPDLNEPAGNLSLLREEPGAYAVIRLMSAS